MLSAAVALLNVLFSLRLIEVQLKPEELPIAAAAFTGAALVLPFALTLLLRGPLSKLRFVSRFILLFGLVHAGAIAALIYFGQLTLADASVMFVKLTGQAEPIKKPAIEKPVVDKAAAEKSPTEKKATTYYRYEKDDVVHFAKSLEEVPEDLRDSATPIEMTEAPPPAPKYETPTPPERVDNLLAIDRLNAYRALLGLSEVSEDRALSGAAEKHAKYLAKHHGHKSLEGLGVHDEEPELEGYSDEGDEAAEKSVIVISTGKPKDVIELWMATFFHRLPLLRPSLTKVGLGVVSGERSVFVMHVGDHSGEWTQVVSYPRDGQTNVPTDFSGSELPNPIPNDEDDKGGYPITIIFPPKQKVRHAVVQLNKGEESVLHYMSAPDSPVVSGRQGNAICLIAEDPLLPNTEYEVRVAATVDGRDYKKVIRFKTH